MMLETRAGPNGLVFDAAIGNLPDLWFGARHPLHSAPWYGLDDPALPPVERHLAGDFLCMPFGKSDLTDDPQHGHSANAAWDILASGPGTVVARLSVPVMGATVTKELALDPAAPLLYQTHRITGGAGQVTLAHHPMIHMASGGRLAFSPKRMALTQAPLEPGQNWLPADARGQDLTAFPTGGDHDLTRYPEARTEDFVTLVEADNSPLGWTAAQRRAENDIVFTLKDPRVLPVTMLWYSNGGRARPPWNGRHTGVLGIEDGIAAGSAGHRAATQDNPVRALGVPTALTLGAPQTIRHVIGAIANPGWSTVTDIAVTGPRLTLTGDSGSAITLPFRPGFL